MMLYVLHLHLFLFFSPNFLGPDTYKKTLFSSIAQQRGEICIIKKGSIILYLRK